MSPQQLREACGDGKGQVSLVIPRQSSNGYSIRLLPRSGPRGVVMCCNRDGNTVARFDCGAILKWLDRMEKEGRLNKGE